MNTNSKNKVVLILIPIVSLILILAIANLFISLNKLKNQISSNYSNINKPQNIQTNIDIINEPIDSPNTIINSDADNMNDDQNTQTSKNNYYVISNHYIDNGINLLIHIVGITNPQLTIYSTFEKVYNLKKESENQYSIDLDLSSLDNGTYKMYIKEDGNNYIKNKLDLLDKLVRGKIQNKLVTLSYDNDIMSFKLEDFNYEYDILIDPGHGGIDGGTYTEKITEAKLNLLQSEYEKKRFEEHGLKVILSRDDDSEGMMMGDENWNRAKQRGYAIGYYGVLAKIVYSNHHNSSLKKDMSGFEILVSSTLNSEELAPEIKITNELLKVYPSNLITNNFQIYSRNIDTGNPHNKINGKIYEYTDYYATIRIPLELYNVKTVTYEGAYMSNSSNFNWYYDNYKKISEVKIKHYVELLGKTYIPA